METVEVAGAVAELVDVVAVADVVVAVVVAGTLEEQMGKSKILVEIL